MSTLAPFANEPVLELRRAPVRAQLEDAMAGLAPTLPLRVPAMIGIHERGDGELLSTDPGEPERVVAVATRAT